MPTCLPCRGWTLLQVHFLAYQCAPMLLAPLAHTCRLPAR